MGEFEAQAIGKPASRVAGNKSSSPGATRTKDPARSNPKEAPDKGEADPRKTAKKGSKRS